VSTQASSCPNCGNPIGSRIIEAGSVNTSNQMKTGGKGTPAWKMILFVAIGFTGLLILILIIPSSSKRDDTSQTTSGNGSSPVIENTIPADERDFISTVNSFEVRYGEAPNEFQKSAIRSERAKGIATLLRSRSVEN
jgi:uncharacterized membrane protein YvbJ